MHVVMLSDKETQGGAAIAVSRIAEGLVKTGARVTRLVYSADGQTHVWRTELLRGRPWEHLVWNRVLRVSRRISCRLTAYAETLWLHPALDVALTELRPDIVTLHNLHGAGWSPNLAAVCVRHAPTVWILHDMWSFTGRCAYSYSCRKFIDGCDALCPTPREYPALAPKLIAGAWASRRRILEANPEMVAVCPSRWLASEALMGLWKGHRVEVIPRGLPLEKYKPLNQTSARAALGVHSRGPVLLAAAPNLLERRKGGSILTQALQHVAHRPLTLLTFGHKIEPLRPEGIDLKQLGFVNDEQTKVLAYNAATVFVHPAPVEAFGLVVMEAIACGTPVVGFPTGGLLDMVRPGRTGWLADSMTSKALAAAIDEAIADPQRASSMRASCRAVAESEYGIELQARRYLELFHSLGAPN
jgi:glycosyltransferase involved in cell wall biosynthesis